MGIVPETVYLLREISELKERLRNEQDPTKLWGLVRKIRKLQKLYNVCVTDEMHKEAMKWETFTNGF